MNPASFEQVVKKEFAVLVCKWLSDLDTPRSRTIENVRAIESLLKQRAISDFFATIIARFQILGETETNVLAYQSMLNTVQNLFKGLTSEHLCFQYFEHKANVYIPPEKIAIAEKDCFQNEKAGNERNVSYQFIPIRKSLKCFFELHHVLENTLSHLSDLENESSIISNVVQGEAWKSKKQNFGDRIVFPYYLYQDDYENNNPLGSHRGVGKVGAIYVMIACLPPSMQSKTENIFLLTLFKTSDSDVAPYYMLLSKAVQELNYLESNGIIVKTETGFTEIRFSLAAFIGDNLAANTVPGFSKGFNALHSCRFCLTATKNFNSVFEESSCVKRTKDSLEKHVIQGDVSSSGVSGPSALMFLQNADTLDIMATDVAHDILEGTFEYDFGLVLHQLIYQDKYFTLDELNSRIDKFNYGKNEKNNRPLPIRAKQIEAKHIKMSAGEAFTLIRNIGLIIGDLVPLENNYWQVIISLKEIMNLIMYPYMSTGIIDFLEHLISEYLRLLVKLWGSTIPNVLKPKHHFLIHYPSVIRRFGPLCNLTTLRFESKNRESKISSHVSQSSEHMCNFSDKIAVTIDLSFLEEM